MYGTNSVCDTVTAFFKAWIMCPRFINLNAIARYLLYSKGFLPTCGLGYITSILTLYCECILPICAYGWTFYQVMKLFNNL